MTDIPTLISMLEKAEAGSRELDAEIGIAAGFAERRKGNVYKLSEAGSTLELYWPAPFSTSLDAAVALVELLLPGQEWSVGSNQPDIGEPWARIRTAPLRSLEESAATPALALCLALLKALEARDG